MAELSLVAETAMRAARRLSSCAILFCSFSKLVGERDTFGRHSQYQSGTDISVASLPDQAPSGWATRSYPQESS